MATYADHVEGVLAAFNATDTVAYGRDDLPDLLPPAYIEIQVSRRFGGTLRCSGETDWRLIRVNARAVGQTLAGAYEMWDRIDALENRMLTVGDEITTPLQFETDDDAIEPDDGWYSGSKSLAYALI